MTENVTPDVFTRTRSVRELLMVKYTIDYYQREYKWHQKQVLELITDLTEKFLDEYQPEHSRSMVANYSPYFMGPIILSKKGEDRYIVDGQQRLTSLTLLLIFLRNLQNNLENVENVPVDTLIVSEQYGRKSFNLDIQPRESCMKSLYDGEQFDTTDCSESIENLINRFEDICENWPDELQGEALPYFIDWLLERVMFVEISAYSDDDAYSIFETMNDRGLSLSPTELLKGYLLANIDDQDDRNNASEIWINQIVKLDAAGKKFKVGKEIEPDCFKAWFRGQYAQNIRERKKAANPEDFDRIGTEFHRWLRDAKDQIALSSSDDYFRFIERDFTFYARHYVRLIEASIQKIDGLEYVRYTSVFGFTLQYMVFFSQIRPGDDDHIIDVKLNLTAKFIEMLLIRRIWNFRNITHSTLQYRIFNIIKDIRNLEIDRLGEYFCNYIKKEDEQFIENSVFYMHNQNRKKIHRILARITDFIEVSSGMSSRYEEYMRGGKNRYEIEHLWPERYEDFQDFFSHPSEFHDTRNRIGGLILLPKSLNASIGNLSYEKKVRHYVTENLLARSLTPECYERNPGFLRFVESTNLPFKSHSVFTPEEQNERNELYRQIAELIWNPNDLLIH